MKYLLEELNCEVTTADTGEIAIELFKKNKYSLIFMDIGLPGKDGYQTALEIKAWEKQHNQYTPIVGLSAHVDETNKQFLASGIEEMFSKPLKNEMATTILNTYVYQKNSKSCNH